MLLFEEKQRTRKGPMRQGEDEYSYYDSSARQPFATYRMLINGWIGHLPVSEQAQTVARLRTKKSAAYQAALSELAIHEAILRQGFKAELHPLGGHPTYRLDFKVRGANDSVIAFTEVTSIAPADAWVAQSNLEARIYNAIDRVELPAGWRLLYSLEKVGADSPPMGQACREIRSWAREKALGDPSTRHERLFTLGQWVVELTLLGGFDPASDDDRAIAGAMGQVRLLTPHLKIRQALENKGSKYGDLNAPYLIVVADCKDELAGGVHNAEALVDAVFGSVTTRFTRQDNGEMLGREERVNNGYWRESGESPHKNVSGVLLLPKPSLWHFRDERSQPLIVRNPWATHPLPDNFFPLPSFNINQGGLITRTDGTLFADLVGLPKPWPPEG